MIIRLALIVSIISLIPIKSQSAVLSIDLGSEWLKVAVVNLKPGQPPISVAINEMSKRKTPSLVAFHSGDRLIGEEAAGLIARYPDKVFAQFRDLIGKPFDYTKKKVDLFYLPYQIVEDDRGFASIRVDNGGVYSIEEMLAMILSHALDLAEFHSKVTVKDAVVSVPPYFGQAERKGVIQAAELAGLNVLALVNEHSGAALEYGIDKKFGNETNNVVFYDMGSSSTYAALVCFSSYNSKEFGKTVSVNQFQVKDVRWDSDLGGQDMELRLVEHFADEFNKQLGNTFDVRKSPKAMAKLKKQVKRTKEILSANTVAPISVESMYDDRDFRSSITREKFEELCEDLWDKALNPIREVIENSGLKVDELDAVELIGGATRVPKLQAKLQEFLGRKKLDKHLDADESIVLGSALHAANLSDGIKLNRKLGMIDGSMYGYVMELDCGDLVKDESTTRQILVQRMKKIPSKMIRSITYDQDFKVSLAYDGSEILPPGLSSLVFAQYVVSGLANVTERYSARNLSAPIKASLHFALSRSGVLTLDWAEAVVEISEWVEVLKKNQTTVDNSTTSEKVTVEASAPANLSAETGSGESSEDGNDSLNADDGDGSNPTSDNKENIAQVTEKKLKKRTFRVQLKVIEKIDGPGAPLSDKLLADAEQRLAELNKKDAERKRTAELKNNLEAYIYSTKEKIETSEEVQKVSTSEEKQSFIGKLEEVQDWLYMDGEDANAGDFEERLNMLKAIGDPIFFRLDELSARPAATELMQKYLSELSEIIRGLETNKPWIPKDRIDKVLSSSDKLRKWLDEMQAEQDKTPASSEPVFTSEEVYDKLADLQAKIARVSKIPKPKPKVEKPVKNETDNGKEQTSGSDGETGEKSDGSASKGAESEAPNHNEL